MMDCGYKLFLYAISFLLAGVYWVSHRMIFSMVKKVNTNLGLVEYIVSHDLFTHSFWWALVGTYSHESVALAAYGVLLIMLAPGVY